MKPNARSNLPSGLIPFAQNAVIITPPASPAVDAKNIHLNRDNVDPLDATIEGRYAYNKPTMNRAIAPQTITVEIIKTIA